LTPHDWNRDRRSRKADLTHVHGLVDPVSTLNCATLASGSAASALMSVVLALARFTSDDALPPKELPP
jgi:hypothetical protein